MDRRASLTRTVVCLWLLWSMFKLDGDQKFVQLMGPISRVACMSEVSAKAPYERRPGPVRYYQDISPAAKAAHPTGIWYGCFPCEMTPDPNDINWKPPATCS